MNERHRLPNRTEPAILKIALDYAARGWHVFPLAPRSKIPLKGSRGLHDATTNPATLHRWFGQDFPYNIAIRTGLISGLLMLDADGQEGVENLERLQAEHGRLPATLMSQSSRGPHLWFKLTVPVPKNESKLAPKIDVRADGGYAVAPPSIHPSGAVYRWLNDLPPAPAPEWLIVLACVKPQPPIVTPRPRPLLTITPGSSAAYGQTALDREIERLVLASSGTRNATLNCASYCLHQLVAGSELHAGEVAERLVAAAQANGLIAENGLHAVLRTIQSGANAGTTFPARSARPAMTKLWQYQLDVIAELGHERAAGKRCILMVAPTGGGKTVIGAAIIKQAIEEFKDVLVLAHRREIIGQTSKKLFDQEIAHGIIQAGMEKFLRPMERVQIASVQTLTARAVRSNRMELPKAELLLIDEAHHTPASTYRKIIEAYPEATLLGLTATPCRGDGRGLGGIFETIVETPQVAELIEGGYLVRTRVYAPVIPDLKGVKVQAGDYNERQLAERMDRPKLIGDIVTHWLKYSERRRTVAFTVNVGHSIHLKEEFVKSGVRAEHIDATTPKAEREATLARLASGEIELVTNCMVLTEGWDMPEVGACILARPTRKMGLYRQMIGRVLRPAPNKADAIVLDHSGAVFRHGFAEDHVEWTLSPDRRAESADHQERSEYGSSSKLLECSQ